MTEKNLDIMGGMDIERARTLSRQPRFKDNGKSDIVDGIYSSVYSWLKLSMDELTQIPYNTDSRKRDEWLHEFWKKEPHWMGVVNQCVLVDSSRPWSLIGGRNQVGRYATILHNANDGKGWRHYFRQASLSYRTSDLGSLTEIGRDGVNGPLRAIYHLDAARCRWSGKPNRPLLYYPLRKVKMQRWRDNWFFDVCSMPSDDERYMGLGYCQTSRAFDLIKLLYGVLMHDQESVGAKMMKGLLLLMGIEEDQWRTAMEGREAQLSEMERKYFAGVFVLASLSTGDLDAKLVSLSQLPVGFDRETFVNQVMFGYSLVAGYDPREFWPVSSGSLGTARETEQQHRKAATKGSLEFPHAWQEKFQAELPDSLLFRFEQRDTDAELLEAEMAQIWVEVVRELYDQGPGGQPGLIDAEQALGILVSKGLVPAEWTKAIEEVTIQSDAGSKVRTLKERAIELPQVRRAIERFPQEPIVVHRWTPLGTTEKTLWESGDAALRRRSYPTVQHSSTIVPKFLENR